jgi:hypothetical protein
MEFIIIIIIILRLHAAYEFNITHYVQFQIHAYKRCSFIEQAKWTFGFREMRGISWV